MTKVTSVQVRPISELFGLEHGEAQVEEHQDGYGEKNALRCRHTRSSTQMRPSIARAKPKNPRTARKSAMDQLSDPPRQHEVNRARTALTRRQRQRVSTLPRRAAGVRIVG